MPSYQSKEYWDLRYFDNLDIFDWYCTYADVKSYIDDCFNKLSQVFYYETMTSRGDEAFSTTIQENNASDNKEDKNEKKENEEHSQQNHVPKIVYMPMPSQNAESSNKEAKVFQCNLNILDMGCGTSLLSHELYMNYTSDKYELHIDGIDFSNRCIDFMKYYHDNIIMKNVDTKAKKNKISFETLSLEEVYNKKNGVNWNKYHLILDKASMDGIMCGNDGLAQAKQNINKYAFKILKKGGIYMMISHTKDTFRSQQLFENGKWSLTVHPFYCWMELAFPSTNMDGSIPTTLDSATAVVDEKNEQMTHNFKIPNVANWQMKAMELNADVAYEWSDSIQEEGKEDAAMTNKKKKRL
ncbi:hypothetical protein RFI_10014 [Reticulomyxa filosa]|uniref:Methyltransferase domain-containing protein n=1 Tax=Reticulomyxa filosa TaxID=46433 RepID=X6NMF6_RETFI|nr:hypothetical protein RFI_10014 [Reticulomyxa filosa]|eukprot:ETO27118.1 hypothetical protein RFI_10014 [Reticulomyxa filosa]